MMPPWRNEYIPLLLDSLSQCLWNQLMLTGVEVRELESTGPINLRAIFADIGRARLTPDPTGIGATPTPPNQARLNEFRFEILRALNSYFLKIVPVVTVCGILAFAVTVIRALRSRSLSPILTINLILLVFFASRTAVLCVVTVMSFDTLKVPYITPLGPILQLLCCLSLYHLSQNSKSANAGRRDAAPGPNHDA